VLLRLYYLFHDGSFSFLKERGAVQKDACLSSEAWVSSHKAKAASGVLVCLTIFRIERLGGQRVSYLSYSITWTSTLLASGFKSAHLVACGTFVSHVR
jgi:hypothetical protein